MLTPGRPVDLILIRVLHPGSFPQDHIGDLGGRWTAGNRYEPLGSDGVWTLEFPVGEPQTADRL